MFVEAFKLVKLDLLCMVLFKCGLKRLWSRSWLAEVLLNLFPEPPRPEVDISGGGEEDDWFDLKYPFGVGLVCELLLDRVMGDSWVFSSS